MTAFAPPAEAHARVAYALAEVRKYIIPDSNDEIRQKQVKNLEEEEALQWFTVYSDNNLNNYFLQLRKLLSNPN